MIQDIRAYQALGVTHFVFDLTPQDLRGQLAMIERFADEVRPAVRAGTRSGGKSGTGTRRAGSARARAKRRPAR